MEFAYRAWRLASLGLVVTMVLVLQVPLAAKTPAAQPDQANAVDLFQAIDNGQVDVKVIPKDSSQLRVMIENKTDKPLTVMLPGAFAAVPILAQAAAFAPAAARGAARNQQPQAVGGGMPGGGMPGGGMPGGGGRGVGAGPLMNIAPEKVGQLMAVATVCLDYGKGEPRAAIPYAIKPIDGYTTQPGIREVCEMLGKGEIKQRVAQVCAWHLNNGLSWEKLAAKQLRFADGSSRPYFTSKEVQAAVKASDAAVQAAKQRAKGKDKPGSTLNKQS
jgi:hypothetical protein